MNKKKIKIFFFNPYPNIGGADTTIHRFINSINLKKYEVDYLTLEKNKKAFKRNINHIKLDTNSTFLSFFKIIKLIKKDNQRQKIFFSMQYFTNIWTIIFIKLFLNIKVFIYEINHLDEFRHFKNLKQFFKKKIIIFLVKLLYRYADVIAGNSAELSKDLAKYINHNVKTIYNPCYSKITSRHKKYKKNTSINILNIARFDDQKDHITLLKAINELKIKKKINLTLIGYGPQENTILDFIKKNKIKAKILNKTKKLSNFYKQSNLFIFTSLYEGLPTTMVEAASYCLPIISSNFKSGSKEILQNGKGGYIFNLKDYKALSKLILKFYSDPRSFYRKEINCRKKIKTFSKKENLKLFNKILISMN